MGDTFLWMPRPRTIVVKDGKPVIDCNPKIGKVAVSFYITSTQLYNCNGNCTLEDSDSVAEAMSSDIAVYGSRGSETKVIYMNGARDHSYSGGYMWAGSGGADTGSDCFFSITSALDFTLAVLPCAPSTTFDVDMSTRATYSANLVCNDGSSIVDTPVCDNQAYINVSNNSVFPVNISYQFTYPGGSSSSGVNLVPGQSEQILYASSSIVADTSYTGTITVSA